MSVVFKEWLPDLPALDNPGVLRAQNVLPAEGTYRSMKTMTVGAAISSTPLGGIAFPRPAAIPAGAINLGEVIGTDTLLLTRQTSGSFATLGSGYTTAPLGYYWRFARFDDQVLATNGLDLPQRMSAGSTAAVVLGSSSGTAPSAKQIGVINRFVLVGDISVSGLRTENFSVQWSGIDQPTSWPADGSSTATAQQAGLQIMPSDGGTLTGISTGDQFGVIFQRNRISRASYVGPPVVFQFDTIDSSRGCFFPNSLVQVGNKSYFAAAFGFFVTDGVTVEPISDNKVSNQFLSSANYASSSAGVYGAVDYENQCIFWTSPLGSGMAIYNYIENRWAYTTETSEFIMSGIAPT